MIYPNTTKHHLAVNCDIITHNQDPTEECKPCCPPASLHFGDLYLDLLSRREMCFHSQHNTQYIKCIHWNPF